MTLAGDIKAVSISSLCQAVGMSRQNWYKEKRTRQHREVNEQLVVKMVQDERLLQPRIGTRKLHKILCPALAENGVAVGRDRMFDILGRYDLQVPPLPRSCKTTNSRHSLPVFHNLIKGMKITAPNQAWASDITYIRIDGSFVYLTLIMDLFSRKIVGYHCGDSLEAIGCIEGLRKAIRDLPEGCHPIHHSDRGSQYCCHEYVKVLDDRRLPISMTELDHCAENATAERLNGVLKQEYGLGMVFKNLEHARRAVDQAVWLYNHRRPHLSLQMKIPAMVHETAA